MHFKAPSGSTAEHRTGGPPTFAKTFIEPPFNCVLCPRLSEFRSSNRIEHPTWYNGPVPSFGDPGARLLVVGLAPGLRGANRTGRPFTGDGAGAPLYAALQHFGFASGTYTGEPDDGLGLDDCAITNAVRCVPPKNRPTGAEIRTCREYLAAELGAFPNLRLVLALGRIAHESTVRALGARPQDEQFTHGGRYRIRDLVLYASYHCSRYNMNTGRLTEEQFRSVFARIRAELDELT